MPEKLTEAQARRICEALGIAPSYRMAIERPTPLGGSVHIVFARFDHAWRIVQRAAEEEKP